MRRRGLLHHATLKTSIPPGEKGDGSLLERDLWDKQALAYLTARITDREFRDEVNKVIKANPLKRGPKVKEGLPSKAFYELIKAEKRAFGSKNIWEALGLYCKLRTLPTDDEYLTQLHTKYAQGSRKRPKN